MSDQILQRLESIEQALTQSDRPLNFNEAADYLSCSKSYLYKLTHKRLIPCSKPLGKKLYFQKSELEKFLMQNPKKTSAEIEQEATDYTTRKAV